MTEEQIKHMGLTFEGNIMVNMINPIWIKGFQRYNFENSCNLYMGFKEKNYKIVYEYFKNKKP